MVPISDHTAFLGILDYQWSAIESLGTASAAAIALTIPTLSAWRARARERKDLAIRLQHIVDSSYIGIITLGQAVIAAREGDIDTYEKNVAWSVGLSERLSLYATRNDLRDEAVDICLSVAAALKMLKIATDKNVRTCSLRITEGDIKTMNTIALHAKTRLGAFCKSEGIVSRHAEGAKNVLRTSIHGA